MDLIIFSRVLSGVSVVLLGLCALASFRRCPACDPLMKQILKFYSCVYVRNPWCPCRIKAGNDQRKADLDAVACSHFICGLKKTDQL